MRISTGIKYSPAILPFLLTVLFIQLYFASPVSAQDYQLGERLVKDQCSTCHKFEGAHESKFNLKGPDLMWAGEKYQSDWLHRWLTGKEANLYPKGYRWDKKTGPQPHVVLSQEGAENVASYFKENLRDSRVKKNAIDLSQFSEMESGFGAKIFKEFSCLGCHQIKEDGKTIGGPISADLFDSGNRYNVDWLLRFAMNPQDFTPHSGEYLADLSGLGVRYIVGYLMTLGVEDYKYYEPWKSDHYKNAQAGRGEQVYKEYCTQCHGANGEGDGPGASGLEPKPAVHAKMALNEFPEDYLYNVIYYGGKSVGKSPNMPDWGLTIPPQGIADLIAYLRVTFKGETGVPAQAQGEVKKARGDCPQKRTTKAVSFKYKGMKNPLEPTAANLKAGEELYQKKAKPMACKLCHGKYGDGRGPGGAGVNPKPRNFTCMETMKDISDGQMFGIIKSGSPRTAMPAFKNLKDKEVWQLVHYIRELGK
jgi:mono/diheme cytochrome c family protein